MPVCELCHSRSPTKEYDEEDPIWLCAECAFHDGLADDPEEGLEEAPQEYDYGACTARDFMQDD